MTNRFHLNKLLRFDGLLIIPVIFLLGISLTILYSLGLGTDENNLGNFYRQLWFLPFGFIIFFFVSHIHHRWYYHYAGVLYWLAVLLLAAVLFFGETIRGTTGWFVWGGTSWQPVEIVKVLWVLWLARFFVKSNFHERPVKALTISLVHLALLVGLILAQPDLGSAILLIASWAALVWLLALPNRYLVGLLGAFLAIAVFSWFFLLADYQKERISTFVNPQADLLGSGYNVRQSIIAIGSGSFWGRGIGEGTQSHLQFLPESQTDFIFAVVGEELGFVGLMLVAVCWLAIIWRMYHIGIRSPDNFSNLIIAGFAGWFAVQAFINMGMNMGLMPVTGLGLPFVSYGRSSLLASFIALGIVMSIARSAKKYTV